MIHEFIADVSRSHKAWKDWLLILSLVKVAEITGLWLCDARNLHRPSVDVRVSVRDRLSGVPLIRETGALVSRQM